MRSLLVTIHLFFFFFQLDSDLASPPRKKSSPTKAASSALGSGPSIFPPGSAVHQQFSQLYNPYLNSAYLQQLQRMPFASPNQQFYAQLPAPPASGPAPAPPAAPSHTVTAGSSSVSQSDPSAG
jgi:hypothetical protein